MIAVSRHIFFFFCFIIWFIVGHRGLFRTEIHLINKRAVVLGYHYRSLIRASFSLLPKHFSHCSKCEVIGERVFLLLGGWVVQAPTFPQGQQSPMGQFRSCGAETASF